MDILDKSLWHYRKPEHLFVFKGDGKVEDHYCTYSEYRTQQIKDEKEFKKIQHLEKENSKVKATRKKLTFNEKYEYDTLEKEISTLELEKKDLELIIQNPDISLEEMMETSKRLGEVIDLVDEKEMRWLELDEMQ